MAFQSLPSTRDGTPYHKPLRAVVAAVQSNPIKYTNKDGKAMSCLKVVLADSDNNFKLATSYSPLTFAFLKADFNVLLKNILVKPNEIVLTSASKVSLMGHACLPPHVLEAAAAMLTTYQPPSPQHITKLKDITKSGIYNIHVKVLQVSLFSSHIKTI